MLYLRNGCAVCHGDDGRGDGGLGATLKPPPRDFREVQSYKKGRDIESIAETISKGLAGTSMPAYAHISAADRMSIARFIAYLQTKSTRGKNIE
jgi:mono/diheme cytochrome c family protein